MKNRQLILLLNISWCLLVFPLATEKTPPSSSHSYIYQLPLPSSPPPPPSSPPPPPPYSPPPLPPPLILNRPDIRPPFNTTSTITKGANIAKPECQKHCGNLTVPYPFGIRVGEPGCALDEGFEIICMPGPVPTASTIARLGGLGMEILDISDGEIRIANGIRWWCGSSSRSVPSQNDTLPTDRPLMFSLSRIPIFHSYSVSDVNGFTVVGCDVNAVLTTSDNNFTNIGCTSRCTASSDAVKGKCSGAGGCCQKEIPKGLRDFNISLSSLSGNQHNHCGFGFLGEASRFQFRGVQDLFNHNHTMYEMSINGYQTRQEMSINVPLVLDWAIGNQSCVEARNRKDYACSNNSHCIDSNTGIGGYRCSCNPGYVGNPYIGCEDRSTHSCERNCINIPGSYNCSCPEGYIGDDKINHRFPRMKFTIAAGVGLLSFIIGSTIWLYVNIKKQKRIKLKEKIFEKNGGLLLKKFFSEGCGSVSKLFSIEEMKRATNNYANDRVLGRGGNGIVYKGILLDNRTVAIKKSRFMDQDKIEEFINEVRILTQINHKNVVKLLGCCLESEVPLLVYEYISHGTLYGHIHDPKRGCWLSLQNRLRIAIETSSALAYLHSSASIIHRDVKSANILLDDSYTAKVADFGASKLVRLDQTHVSTLVQGTLGYLDPEYFQTSKLTEKSDVYSFGVVLAELLTGMKPILRDRNGEDRNLANHFVVAINNGRLFQILDRRVIKEGSFEQLQKMAELVKSCLELHGEDRPTMKDITMELERLRNFIICSPSASAGQEEIEDEISDLYAIPFDDSNTDINNFSGQLNIYSSEFYGR